MKNKYYVDDWQTTGKIYDKVSLHSVFSFAETEANMYKQTSKTAALYYRAAVKSLNEMHLDNQMQKLLCCASKQGFDSFMLYADVRGRGFNFNRPALNALKADIEAGRIETLIIRDISRLGRDLLLTGEFIEWVHLQGVEIFCVTENKTVSKMFSDMHFSIFGGVLA